MARLNSKHIFFVETTQYGGKTELAGKPNALSYIINGRSKEANVCVVKQKGEFRQISFRNKPKKFFSRRWVRLNPIGGLQESKQIGWL